MILTNWNICTKKSFDAYLEQGDKQIAAVHLKLVIDFEKSLHLSQEYVDKLQTKLNENQNYMRIL